MSQPPVYDPRVNFQQEESNAVAGRSTVRTAALDTELALLETFSQVVVSNLSYLQRDDKELRDKILKLNALSTEVLALMGSGGFTINDPVAWTTATVYAARSIIKQGTGTYVAVVAHTSGTFATDLSNGKWVLIFDSATLTATAVTFTPTGTISASNAQDAIAEAASDALQKNSNLSDVQSVTAARINLGVSVTAVNKNAIIGGDFSINPWQRGISLTSVANGAYTADRWHWSSVGTGVVNISKSADAPTVAQAGRFATDCLLVDCTTADASIAAADNYGVVQKIEGYNFIPLAQNQKAFQFWHRHTKTGTYCVAFRNSGNDRSYVAEYTQAVSDIWELATIIIAASPSAGTWNYTNGVGLSVHFTLAAGTDFQTSAGAWQTGNFLATANQVNGLDNVVNNFRIALVQLERGATATEFEIRTFPQELASCQRYFEKTFEIGTTPAQAAGLVGVTQHLIASVVAGARTNGVVFKTRKRAVPTITTYNPSAANANARDTIGALDLANTGTENIGEAGFSVLFDTTGSAASRAGSLHWTASAEL